MHRVKCKVSVLVALIVLGSCAKTKIDRVNEVNELPVNSNGDSLTAGAGSTGGESYPYFLQQLIGRAVNNNGIGGQIAEEIAARQGGLPLSITIKGGKFDGTLPIPITELTSTVNGNTVENDFLSSPGNSPATISGTVVGVKCTITFNGKSYSISPNENVSIGVPPGSIFIPDDGNSQDNCIGIYWVGRNNVGKRPSVDGSVYGVTEIVDKMVKYNKSGKFLVVGILNALNEITGTNAYASVTETNKRLSDTYGECYVPMTPPTSEEMSAVNFTPTESDKRDIENGVFPRGLRHDAIHLNNSGYRIVANRVFKYFKQNSY